MDGHTWKSGYQNTECSYCGVKKVDLVKAIGNLCNLDYSDYLFNLFVDENNEENWLVRVAALDAIGKLPEIEYLPFLVDLLPKYCPHSSAVFYDEVNETFTTSFEKLFGQHKKDALPLLYLYIQNKESHQRNYVAEVMVRGFGKEAALYLIMMLNNENEDNNFKKTAKNQLNKFITENELDELTKKLYENEANNITDQTVLAKIVQNENEPILCDISINKINEQHLLIYIARNAKNFYPRLKAVEKLTDQNALSECALYNTYYPVRKAAVVKLIDQSILEEIAINDKEPKVRYAAVTKLTNQFVLAQIAQSDAEFIVRTSAIDKLTEPGLLAGVIKNSKSWDEAHIALRKLNYDQVLLVEFIKIHKNSFDRKEAVKHLKDQSILAEILKNERDTLF